ncbi:hypothetical protein EV421DRAFT_1745799 [Armillaria borealis]|uniref:Uncharacterized protein n=1 Tax=Armillaria borealis TaxID=47425 RepID=A0AA39M518_9AGAR|nr:hypothetical protein EV421DRAFT_1745799 [Armillaria borealis]
MTRLSCQHITTSPGTTRADCEEPIKVTTLGARNLRAISRRHLPPSSGGIVTFGGDDNEKSGRLHTGSQPRNPVPDQNTSPAIINKIHDVPGRMTLAPSTWEGKNLLGLPSMDMDALAQS